MMTKPITCALLALLALLSISAAQAEVWEARYGVAETFNFKLYNADGTLDVDEVDGGTEVSLSCNEGDETTATNDFVDEGTFYSITLTAAELECKRVAVVIAATTTEVFFIQTIDNTSAMTPMIVQTGDSFARIGATGSGLTSLASQTSVNTIDTEVGVIDGIVDSILVDTAEIGTAGAGLTNINLPNQTMDVVGNITGNLSGSVGSVTGTVTANMTQVSGDSAVADRLEAMLDGTCGSYAELGITRGVGCTAQAYTAATPSITLDSSAAFGDNTLEGATILICGSTQGYCQPALAVSNVGSTDVVTLAEALPVEATGTITYTIFGTAAITGGSGLDAAGVRAAVGLASANLDTQLSTIDGNVDSILVDTGTTLQAELDGIQADTEDLQTRVPAALVSGRMDASVGAMAANVMTAAAAATDLTTELQTGLATAAALATVDTVADEIKVTTDKLDDTLEDDAGTFRFTANALEQAPTGSGESLEAIADAVWDELLSGHAVSGSTGEALTSASAGGGLDAAGVRAAIGLASANLDTQLGDIPTVSEFNARTLASASYATAAAQAVIDDIVDQLLIGVNVEQMNGEDVCGTGDPGTPWTGCP